MERLHKGKLLQRLCALEKKWGLYISSDDDMQEITKAAPFLTMLEDSQILYDGEGWFLFDSQEECEATYYLCVGDDGPTSTNPYTGPARVYALTCGPDGRLRNENT